VGALASPVFRMRLCYTHNRSMSTVLELYEKLKPKLGDAEARALLEFVETSVELRAATKEDLQRTASSFKEDLQRSASSLKEDLLHTEVVLCKEIQGVEVVLCKEIQGVEVVLRKEIQGVEAVLRKEIQEVRVDLLKWSFAFWVGAIAVLSGIMFTMLRSLPAR